MNFSIVFSANEPASLGTIVANLAPHIFWGLLILVVTLLIGPTRIREALLHVRKVGFGGFEIELEGDIANAARARKIDLPPQLSDQLARRAVRLGPIIAGARLLWIDDVPANNVNEIRLLNRLRITIDLAASDIEARGCLATAVYDLVISDIRRGSDGEAGKKFLPEVTRAMLEPPVIFYVGSDRDVPQGAFGLTTRPDTLLRLILDALERRRA